jgi:hypothetical protein
MNDIEIPQLPFSIKLIGNRILYIYGLEDWLCEKTNQKVYIGNLRSWTDNCSWICEDVLKTIIAGGEFLGEENERIQEN